MHWHHFRRLARAAFAVLLAISLAACVSDGRPDYSALTYSAANVEGFAGIRFWGDASAEEMMASLPPGAGVSDRAAIVQPQTLLALSGGGAAGAFSAGLMSGWTRRGDRPKFDVVTGVSAGALVAPMAYLGSGYDKRLQALFTSGVAEKLEKPRFPVAGLFGESLFQSQPLEDLIAQHVDAAMLSQIAKEHRKGRRLIVVTTNLDAQRAVIWDMGAIAASTNPNRLKLFRNVLQASASIPGIFPAVKIEVVADGARYSELHSDGGSSTQIFVAPDALIAGQQNFPVKPKPGAKLYVVINNTLEPEFKLVSNSTLSVAERAYSTFIKAQTQSSIYAAYGFAKREKLNFFLTYVDEQVPYKFSDPFETRYMRQLYNIGFKNGRGGRWSTAPNVVAGGI